MNTEIYLLSRIENIKNDSLATGRNWQETYYIYKTHTVKMMACDDENYECGYHHKL